LKKAEWHGKAALQSWPLTRACGTVIWAFESVAPLGLGSQSAAAHRG
jgi:hypothetical protein